MVRTPPTLRSLASAGKMVCCRVLAGAFRNQLLHGVQIGGFLVPDELGDERWPGARRIGSAHPVRSRHVFLRKLRTRFAHIVPGSRARCAPGQDSRIESGVLKREAALLHKAKRLNAPSSFAVHREP